MPGEQAAGTGPGADLNALAGRLAGTAGQVLGRSGPIVITQAEEDAFAALIGDWDPMHNDPRWQARNNDGPIVLGYHMLARLADLVRGCPPLAEAAGSVAVTTTGLDGVRFPAPLPVGATAEVEVSVAGVTAGAGGIVLTTTHRCTIEGSDRPTMVATHTALLTGRATGPGSSGRPDSAGPAGPAGGGPATAVADIPAGAPLPPAAAYDDRFFTALARRAGEWLGSTQWTSVSDREAHAFALLCGSSGDPGGHSPAHPFAGRPVPRLHLLALRAYFSPQVGLPVLTDESMMAFNYGVDRARWRGAVLPGTRLRDHVQLAAVRARAPGDYLVTTRHVVEAEGDPGAVLVADCKTLYRVTT